MPKHQVIRRVKMAGGMVVNKVVNIGRYKPAQTTEIVKTDYNKPVEAPVEATNPKKKKSVVEEKKEVVDRPSQSKNQPMKEVIPVNIVTFDESKSKATRAQVLKAINQALIGKPKKLGQRGGFLKRLE
jgi:hypothetical protein